MLSFMFFSQQVDICMLFDNNSLFWTIYKLFLENPLFKIFN